MTCLPGLALVTIPALRDEWTHKHPLKGRVDLHLKTDDGSIDVQPVSSRVSSRRTTEASPPTAFRGEIRVHAGDGSMKVRGRSEGAPP